MERDGGTALRSSRASDLPTLPRVRRRARFPRSGGSGDERDLRRTASLVVVRAQRSCTRQRSLSYKLSWLGALRVALAASQPVSPPLVVCGDFNIAPSDDDVWDPAAFIGSTHVSPPERAGPSCADEPRAGRRAPASSQGTSFTYWDYRAGNFHKVWACASILVLLDHAVTPAVTDAYIDRDARKETLPSDHAPLVVDLDWPR